MRLVLHNSSRILSNWWVASVFLMHLPAFTSKRLNNLHQYHARVVPDYRAAKTSIIIQAIDARAVFWTATVSAYGLAQRVAWPTDSQLPPSLDLVQLQLLGNPTHERNQQSRGNRAKTASSGSFGPPLNARRPSTDSLAAEASHSSRQNLTQA